MMLTRFGRCVVITGLLFGGALGASGQDESGVDAPTPERRPLSGEQERAGATVIALSDLPTPPESITKLIRSANVSFRFGGNSVTDPARLREGRRRLAAETTFKLKCDYRARSNWNVRKRAGERQVVIQIHYRRAKLIGSHQVWFRKLPKAEGFWENPLVLHELDHVRISSDARIEKLFVARLKESATVTKPIRDFSTANARVDEPTIRKVVDATVQEVFSETVELVQIRYKELDRLTSHGIKPVPPDSDVAKWLENPGS